MINIINPNDLNEKIKDKAFMVIGTFDSKLNDFDKNC
jgi:hypothetical protein